MDPESSSSRKASRASRDWWRTGTYTRTDAHGGSPENRARLVIEVVTAVAEAIGAGRTGLRISPEHNIQGAVESDPADTAATYAALIDGIAPLGLAALSILHADPAGALVQDLRERFDGPVLLNTGFQTVTTFDDAAAVAANGWGDAVVVGRPAIANPDLVRRWQEGLPLNEPDASTFYTEGAAGYTDYPFWANWPFDVPKVQPQGRAPAAGDTMQVGVNAGGEPRWPAGHRPPVTMPWDSPPGDRPCCGAGARPLPRQRPAPGRRAPPAPGRRRPGR